ncbi:MAG: DegV family protein [Clostridia bacterium]|nr:DegV family protein [Clostridia bacterium]
MDKIKLITDSASDITIEQERENDITVLNYSFLLDEKSYESRVDVTNEEFYRLLENSPSLPSTSQITVFRFTELYESVWAEGYTDAVVTLINKEASATFGNAEAAREQFYEAHPECRDSFRIRLIDSRTYTFGYGYAVLAAAEMVKAGKSADEVEAFILDWLSHVLIYFAPYTLKYAKKSGRIPGAVAVVGEALGIKPIMRICDHKIDNNEMIRGEKKLVPKIAEKVMSEIEVGSPYIVLNGNNPADGDTMEKAMTDALGYAPVARTEIGAIISSHAGPKVVGVVFRSKNANY